MPDLVDHGDLRRLPGFSLALRRFAEGPDPVEHRDIGDLQNPSDGPKAHAFQIKPERLRPQLGRLARRRAAREFAAAVPAAPALRRTDEARLATILRPTFQTMHLQTPPALPLADRIPSQKSKS